jgi:ATP adenylyltransferase
VTAFAMLNIYPYTSGHTMVMPKRPVGSLADLTNDEHAELWSMVRDAVAAIEAAYGPGGINVGLNQGRAAGAGIPEHIHVHCVARWSGDTNFMTATAGARVLPEALVESWSKLREHWPA